VFGKGWSDEEAAAEAEELFPGLDVCDPDEAGLVCDECYQRIMALARAEAAGTDRGRLALLHDAGRLPGSRQARMQVPRSIFHSAKARVNSSHPGLPAC